MKRFPGFLLFCFTICMAFACGSDEDSTDGGPLSPEFVDTVAGQSTSGQGGTAMTAGSGGQGLQPLSGAGGSPPGTSGTPAVQAGTGGNPIEVVDAGRTDAVVTEAGITEAGSTTDVGSDSGVAPDGSCVGDECSEPLPCLDDSCPYDDGVDWLCRLRFMYGVNLAWHHFAGDFGGISGWNQKGVSQEPAVEAELSELAANGVNVIRWWVWPDFRGDGVTFDEQDRPSGLGVTTEADLKRALELAEQYDLYLMLTLFSFDNFRPTHDESGLLVRSIAPIILDDNQRRMLMDNVVRPFVRIVANSSHKSRVIAWDVINEPEWAISGEGLYGDDQPFDPMTNISTVSHAEMETFVRDVIAVLRAESDSLITVGATAMKWKHAWSNVDIDFHQFHIYDWVDAYWPYSESPTFYGVDNKPVVMGEFPWFGLSSANYPTLLNSWFSNGYAGALAWSVTDGGRGNLGEIKSFGDTRACQTRY